MDVGSTNRASKAAGSSVAAGIAAVEFESPDPIAVVAVALASGSSGALAPERVVEQLRWGAGWLEALPWAKYSVEAQELLEKGLLSEA